MNTWQRNPPLRSIFGAFFVGLVITAHSMALAQVSGTPPAEGDTSPPQLREPGTTDELGGSSLPPLAVDNGFDRLVQFVDLADIINSRDSKALADFALLTKAAEDLLKRTHSSGVKSDTLLQLANELAVQQRDDETVARLTSARIVGSSNDTFYKDVKALDIPANTSPEVVALYQGLQDEIKTAVLLDDAARVAKVKAVAEGSDELSSAM